MRLGMTYCEVEAMAPMARFDDFEAMTRMSGWEPPTGEKICFLNQWIGFHGKFYRKTPHDLDG